MNDLLTDDEDDISEIPEEPRARANSSFARSPKNSSSEQQHPQLVKKHSTSEPTLPIADKEPVNTNYVPNGRRRSASHTVASSRNADYYIQNLSQEEIDALVIDIFKPLDFYEILFERMKNNDSQQESDAGQSADPQ